MWGYRRKSTSASSALYAARRFSQRKEGSLRQLVPFVSVARSDRRLARIHRKSRIKGVRPRRKSKRSQAARDIDGISHSSRDFLVGQFPLAGNKDHPIRDQFPRGRTGAIAKQKIGISAAAAAAATITILINMLRAGSAGFREIAKVPANAKTPAAKTSAITNPIHLFRRRRGNPNFSVCADMRAKKLLVEAVRLSPVIQMKSFRDVLVRQSGPTTLHWLRSGGHRETVKKF